mmetsp:Transcript_33200/g.66169  ORF Transcript_33200/g.66169 Transcript_33200/m.66169 type:complete len:259 (-) Transcript_33200:420-1196(-)
MRRSYRVSMHVNKGLPARYSAHTSAAAASSITFMRAAVKSGAVLCIECAEPGNSRTSAAGSALAIPWMPSSPSQKHTVSFRSATHKWTGNDTGNTDIAIQASRPSAVPNTVSLARFAARGLMSLNQPPAGCSRMRSPFHESILPPSYHGSSAFFAAAKSSNSLPLASLPKGARASAENAPGVCGAGLTRGVTHISSTTRAATSPGESAARRMAILPPIEWPTTTKRRPARCCSFAIAATSLASMPGEKSLGSPNFDSP